MKLTGSCYCRALKYELDLDSVDDAWTSLCHCKNCKKVFGTNYGLTMKVPLQAVKYTAGRPQEHKADNGSGTMIYREFCSHCGSYILEYGERAKALFRYICVGSLDDPEHPAAHPKGEFFCKTRATWMPAVPGVFHKREIQE
ncbi:DUF636 domain protein [Trichodelitschia bisporula]|uniref:DUF636 domain protein n=1 Tax=Trichodelitschia bisporula TaxID=703511 RepID=A0A6G1HLV2_9PEZI|nr:DUF636 domain protein [Trichodelitschia bisporula]